MSMTVEVDDSSVRTFFDELPDKVHDNVLRTVEKIAILLQNKVRNEKLAGQVLNYRTHHLQQSIQTDVQDNGASIMGEVFANQTLAPYAAIHEYGGVINHPGGTAYFISQLLGGKAFFVANNSPMAAYLPRTQPHTITMPERSYMRSSLAEMADQITQDIKEAVNQGLQQ